MKTLKALLAIAGLALDVAVLLLAVLMFLGGYFFWSALAGIAALGSLGVAVWRATRPGLVPVPREWRVLDEDLPDELSEVEQLMERGPIWDLSVVCPDEVDAHAAQMIRALSGQSAVLPERGLLEPQRPQCPEGMMFNGDVTTLIRCTRHGGHEGNHQGQGREWPHLPQITNFEVPW